MSAANKEDADHCLNRPLKKDEVATLEFDFTAEAGRRNTTVDSVAWSTEDTSTVSLGTSSLNGSTSSCPVTASNEGKALIKIVATLANSDTVPTDLCVEVVDRRRCW